MKIKALVLASALGCVFAGGVAAAAPLSGDASGGGAIQGGDGEPGGGVGIPGAIVNNTTAEGIGEDDTLGAALAPGDYLAMAPTTPAQPRHATHLRHALRLKSGD